MEKFAPKEMPKSNPLSREKAIFNLKSVYLCNLHLLAECKYRPRTRWKCDLLSNSEKSEKIEIKS